MESEPDPSATSARPRADPDLGLLERYLKILADPSRLKLLALLRVPRTVEEIQLAPHRPLAGQDRERPMTRQAVRNHLYQLSEANLVRVRLARRDSRRSLQEFVLDPCMLFGIAEDLRQIATLESHAGMDPSETLTLQDFQESLWEYGPKLVHLNGPHEGQAMPLDSTRLRDGRGWILGRAVQSQLCVEYDAYVHLEQAELVRDPQGYSILDLRSAPNPTVINWHVLGRGESQRLRRGDVVQVGRSLLLFLDE
jgi:DNA-binding transcriptional ArsR family regulator